MMHKNNEGESVFEMLNKALDIARDEKKLTEHRSIGILIAQMHVVKVICYLFLGHVSIDFLSA